MLGGNNLISQPNLTTAKVSYQNLAITNRGPGGAAKHDPPPDRVIGALQATG